MPEYNVVADKIVPEHVLIILVLNKNILFYCHINNLYFYNKKNY